MPGGPGATGGPGQDPIGAKGGAGGYGGAGGAGGGAEEAKGGLANLARLVNYDPSRNVFNFNLKLINLFRWRVEYPADVTAHECPNYPYCQDEV